jgi:Transposase DDE domain
MEIESIFVEKRLKRTGKEFFDRMVHCKTSVINRFAKNTNQNIRFYRWINHPKISKEELINASTKQLSSLVKDRHVLAIQDTTEINYQAHSGRVKDLGTVGNGSDVGLFLHPLFVIDAETAQGLGFGAIHTWNRFRKKDPAYKQLPIEEKESYRWIKTAETGKKNLSEASCITFISDRESDIYEFLNRIPDEKTHLLVRGKANRKLIEGDNIETLLESQPIKKTFDLELPRTNKNKKTTASVDLRFSTVSIKRPKKAGNREESPFINLSVVQIKESNPKKDAIDWLLLTTHDINTVQDAEQIVFWYKQRWQIEQLFRTIKSQGLNIEASQLETEASLTKLVIVALNAANKIMQLVLCRKGNTAHKTNIIFDKKAIACLIALLPTLEGRTQKQKNPYPIENLAWASWIIGRLGGWKGLSKTLAGPITMGRGLEKFYATLQGFLLSKDAYKE